MAQIGEVLSGAAERLQEVSESPQLDAELLLAQTLDWPRAKLLAEKKLELDAASIERFEALVTRRLAFEPVAYIVGRREFFSLDFVVRPPVLIPRPETEHLVEAALEHLAQGGERVLDMCTGTGCVGIAIAKNAGRPIELFLCDLVNAAIELAEENAKAHGLSPTLLHGDLFAKVPEGVRFDVIVSNPPYVALMDWLEIAPDIRDYEDPMALLAGVDGLDVVRRIVEESPDYLMDGGLLALEIGERQYPDVAELMRARGFRDVRARRDLAGIDRIAQGVWG